jgi:pyruvate-ferredoxin/flavodoxin oxidoreductase
MPSTPETPSGRIAEQVIAQAGELWQSTRTAIADLLDGVIADLQQLCDRDTEDQALHSGAQLRQTLGPFAEAAVDSESLAGVLAAAGRQRAVAPQRLARIQATLAGLRNLRAAWQQTPPACVVLRGNESMDAIRTRCAGHLDAMARAFRLLRMGQLELAAQYVPERHDALFNAFGWRDLSAAERKLCPPCLVMADAAPAGAEQLAWMLRLLGCGLPLKVVAPHRLPDLASLALASEAGMPDTMLLPVGLPGVFAAQAASTSPELAGLVARALLSPRPVLLALLDAPAATAARAIAARAFPLFVYDPDQGEDFAARFDLSGNPAPAALWCAAPDANTGRVAPAGSVADAFTFADLAAAEPLLADAFAEPPAQLPAQRLLPVADFLARPPAQRTRLVAVVQANGADGQVRTRVPAPMILNHAAACLHNWRMLQQMAGLAAPHLQPGGAPGKAPPGGLAAGASGGQLAAGAEHDQAVIAAAIRQLVAQLTGVAPEEIPIHAPVAADKPDARKA